MRPASTFFIICQFPLSGTDGSGYEVAASHAYHEGQRLDNCHGREDNAYGTRSTGSQLAYEKRIGHVVNRSHQHADDGRNCQFRNDPVDRGVGHLIVLVVLCSCIFSQIKHLNFLCNMTKASIAYIKKSSNS